VAFVFLISLYLKTGSVGLVFQSCFWHVWSALKFIFGREALWHYVEKVLYCPMTVLCSGGNTQEAAQWRESQSLFWIPAELYRISSGHWTRLPKWKWPECQDGRKVECACGTQLSRTGRSVWRAGVSFFSCNDLEIIVARAGSKWATSDSGAKSPPSDPSKWLSCSN
jgi:hypothetical protein